MQRNARKSRLESCEIHVPEVSFNAGSCHIYIVQHGGMRMSNPIIKTWHLSDPMGHACNQESTRCCGYIDVKCMHGILERDTNHHESGDGDPRL